MTNNGTPNTVISNNISGTTGNGSTNQKVEYLNNLDNSVNNWIYGNINSQVFYAEVNKKLQAGAKLCPSQNPYLD